MGDRAGEGPLAGLRVLEFARGRAGSIAGMLLADYGADVLRIEPPGGDPFWDEVPGYPVWHRGKEVVQIDLATVEAREAIAKRLGVADVLLDGLRPGVLEQAGLGFEACRTRAPGLVYVSISGFDGAHDAPGYEAMVQAWLGLPGYQGAPHGTPSIAAYPAASYGAGLLAVIGALAALHQRERTGQGQHVRTSLLDGMLAQLTMTLVSPLGEPTGVPPVSGSAPTLSIYRCAEGSYLQIHLGARGSLERLFEATGLDPGEFVHPGTGRHFAGDPEGGERFRKALARVLASRPCSEWIEIFTEADVPVAACLAPGEALDHEQTDALGMAMELNDPVLGPVRCAAPPIVFGGAPTRVRGAALQRGMPRNPEAALRHTGWLTTEELAVFEPPRLGEHHDPTEPAAGVPHEGGPASEAIREAPLADLRVLDFGMFAAGPYAAMLLAELGADVIKVEPPAGDTMRPNARPFSGLHRGKRGLSLDLKAPDAAPVVEALVGRADVLLHNFRPGVAERLGLGAERLLALKPSLVHFHSSGYGSRGPMARLPGFDQIYQAFCGMSVAQGGEGQPPEQVAGAPLDCLNALLTAAGVLMAIRQRDRGGLGQSAECAQLSAGLFALSENYRTSEGIEYRPLSADRRRAADGYRIEKTRDGWIFVCCPDEKAREALERFEGEYGLRWSEIAGTEVLDRLGALGVPACSLRERFDDGLLEDPVLVETGRSVLVDDGALGPVRQPGGFLRLSNAALPSARGGPGLGEHSREILAELGLEASAIDELIRAGVVRQSEEDA
jgi:crotonobetainyl-CoA:carnitine CoA-transferase CaiB-like acyl-CoA transferase